MNPNVVMIEKHYIPIDLYRQLFTTTGVRPQPPLQFYAPTPINTFVGGGPVGSQAPPPPPPQTAEVPVPPVGTENHPLNRNLLETFISSLLLARNVQIAVEPSEDYYDEGVSIHNLSRNSVVGVATVDGDCSICQDAIAKNDITRTLNTCHHLFHLACIDEWVASHFTCPVCRAPVLAEDTSTN